jgi:hypothetical protein
MPVLLSIDEVDSRLADAHEVPAEERGDPWHAYVNALLERRTAIETAEANLTRILQER